MQTYTHFEELIFKFCQRHRVGMIQPDENLHYVLYVDDDEVRCFSAKSDIFQLVELGALPDQPQLRTALYKQLMQQSLLSCEQTHCTLSLNEQNSLTVFQRMALDESQLSNFEESMAELANQADLQNEILSQAR